MTAGETKYSYYKPKLIVHKLTSDEAGSGTFTLDPFPNDTISYSGSVVATVKTSDDGELRTVTNAYLDKDTGNITVAGTSFAENDEAEILVIKYV